jgi:hypothetical protein
MNEERFEPWATQAESTIERSVEGGQWGCDLRYVECRTTVCVYECVAPPATYNVVRHVVSLRKDKLEHVSNVIGVERDEFGNAILVTLTVVGRMD